MGLANILLVCMVAQLFGVDIVFFDIYKKLCEENGESPYNLPVNLGIMKKNSGVAQWKKGSVPRNDTLQILADHFSVSVAYLMGLENKETPRPETEAISEERRALNEMVDKMSKAELLLLIERAERIIESRG